MGDAMRLLAAILVMVGPGATAALGDGRCMYANEFFSPGAVSCQGGAQYRCAAGSWQATGLDCADTQADGAEEGRRVDPSRSSPSVQEPDVRQPSAPAVPKD